MKIYDILLIILSIHAIYTEYRLFRLRKDGELLGILIDESKADNIEFIKLINEFKNYVEELNKNE